MDLSKNYWEMNKKEADEYKKLTGKNAYLKPVNNSNLYRDNKTNSKHDFYGYGVDEKPCAACGESFFGGRWKKYCSRLCRVAEKGIEKKCAECSKVVKMNTRQKFCNRLCRVEHHKKKFLKKMGWG